ncbi:MAG: RluA family pseudouridine synthase [Planctomycetota bacterium]|jgi:RluA family pseudouridine synthase
MRKAIAEIIYQDQEIIVINKPSGVSVTADRSGKAELVDILTEQLGPQMSSQLRLVHRLDKGTSGVMILALNPQAQAEFSRYFEKKLVKKTYLALVTGVVPNREGTINAPLAQSRKKAQIMRIVQKRGKEAITHWRLLADFGTAALLAVSPVTGRTHQIRVHLPGIGLALAIDPLYGSSKALFLSDFKADYHLGKERIEKPLIDRLTLHSYQIELPETGENRPTCFVASLDKKLTACIKMLTKYNPKGLDSFFNPDDFNRIVDAQRL